MYPKAGRWHRVPLLNNAIAQFIVGKTSENLLLRDLASHDCIPPQTTKVLLFYGAGVEIKNQSGLTPLIVGLRADSNFENIILLLKNGADPNVQDRWGNIPLIYAFKEYSDKRIIKHLLAYGADPNICNNKCESPISLMLGSTDPKRRLHFVMLLFKYVTDQNMKDKMNFSIFEIACDKGFKELEQLIDVYFPLTQLLDSRDQNVLLKLPDNVNNLILECSLSRVVTNCYRSFKNKEFEAYKQHVKFLQSLLESGRFNPQLDDFAKVIKYGWVHVAKLLAEYTSEVGLNNMIVFAQSRYQSIVKEIQTIFDKNKKEIIASGALSKNVKLIYKKKYALKSLRTIIELLYNMNPSSDLLIYALNTHSFKYLKYILKKNVIDINKPVLILYDQFKRTINMLTPLQLAVQSNDVPNVTLLLEYGANPNYFPENTLPVLISAVKNSNFNLVKLLLEYNADVELKDNSDKNAFDYAVELGNERIIDLLLYSGV